MKLLTLYLFFVASSTSTKIRWKSGGLITLLLFPFARYYIDELTDSATYIHTTLRSQSPNTSVCVQMYISNSSIPPASA